MSTPEIPSPELVALQEAVDAEMREFRAHGMPIEQLKEWAARKKYALARVHCEPSWRRIAAYRNRFTSMLFKKWRNDPLFDGPATHKRTSTCERLCGCSWQQMRDHIEQQFRPGMDWENHGSGRHEWVVDHVKAIAMFDWWTDAGLAEAFHWTNVQPLWLLEHRAKSIEDVKLARQRRWDDGEYRKRLSTKQLPPLMGTDEEIMAQLERQLNAA
jgi:hypothetical protein